VFNESTYSFRDLFLSTSHSNNSSKVECLVPTTILVIFPSANFSFHSSLETLEPTIVVPNISNSSSPPSTCSFTS